MENKILDALFLVKKNIRMFYAYGFNQYNVYGIKSIHAEVDALNKLKSNKKKKT